MAGTEIRFDLHELVALDGRLARTYDRSRDLSPLMDAIGQAFEGSTHDRFASERNPDGVPWKRSDWSRKKTKKTLTEDRFLDDSITHRFGADFAEIGSPLVYARPHNEGWPEGGLPKRQFLGIGGDDPETARELVAEFYLQDLAA